VLGVTGGYGPQELNFAVIQSSRALLLPQRFLRSGNTSINAWQEGIRTLSTVKGVFYELNRTEEAAGLLS
jgi:hypothetical protein